MFGLPKEQSCPYCNQPVEDCHAVWEEEGEDVVCDSCGKTYVVKPQYKFEGFLIEQQCDDCGEWTEDGIRFCDCGDDV